MLWSAADYKLPQNQEPALSEQLENLLISMTQDNQDVRPAVTDVLQVSGGRGSLYAIVVLLCYGGIICYGGIVMLWWYCYSMVGLLCYCGIVMLWWDCYAMEGLLCYGGVVMLNGGIFAMLWWDCYAMVVLLCYGGIVMLWWDC